MLEGERMTSGNRYTYTICIDNGLIYNDGGEARNIFSFHRGTLQRTIIF